MGIQYELFDKQPPMDFHQYMIMVDLPDSIKEEITFFKKIFYDLFGKAEKYLESQPHITVGALLVQEKHEEFLFQRIAEQLTSRKFIDLAFEGFNTFDNNGLLSLAVMKGDLQSLAAALHVLLRMEQDYVKEIHVNDEYPHATIAITKSRSQLRKSEYFFGGLPYRRSFSIAALSVLRRRGPEYPWISIGQKIKL